MMKLNLFKENLHTKILYLKYFRQKSEFKNILILAKETMEWYSGSIPEAVNEAKRNNKLFLVYIEGTDDMSKSMTDSYNDPGVAGKLSSQNIVALKLAANSVPYQQFSQIYPVLVIPSSFFIGNGSPIEIITGSLPPDKFSNKLDQVFQMYEKTLGAKKEAGSSKNPVASTSKANDVPEPSVSQAGSSSNEPSTSQTETASDSSQLLQDKVERAKALVEAQRLKKAQEEKEKEKQEEIQRRTMGKAIQQAEQTKQDKEMQEWAKNRAKEKEEERLAREKVKAMIAQDRAERAAKYQKTKEVEQAEKERAAKSREEAERSMRSAAMNSNEARIQFRKPDGSCSTHSFSADATLADARRFVIEEVRPPFSNFTLCTTFPRRHFAESNYSESLRDLQLAPSAVLLILPAQDVSVSNNGGFLANLFWMVLSPFQGIWNLLRSLWPGGSPEAPPPQPTPPSQPQPSTSKESPDNSRPKTGPRPSSFAKREGNIFRINNQSDDDENNTWNGNSTQQM
ncbi:hypothetical protein JTE90_000171 [Oedothorax gibbosus]|uniref:UBX domain-containing protein 4 n=1 Tax=Oedothorax gibbosus TaxID=931172 RepID=A0AAV6UTX0_9ARAC|nr:hypothetical protein JTE90_000171 [Oedothorax gibbosus]